MSEYYGLLKSIQLFIEGRISMEDANRQSRTAQEILSRFATHPGLILADEVGMGKTFVSLAVAASVALQNKDNLPVVIMVPSALKEKWPADFSVFREMCLPAGHAVRLRCATADRPTQFLRFLDGAPDQRSSIIFMTHGAMSCGLTDKWVMLAVIYSAILRRHNSDALRRILGQAMGELLQVKSNSKQNPKIWEKLLGVNPCEWGKIVRRSGLCLNGDESDDDPVPDAICRVLPQLDTSKVYQALFKIPKRRSKNYQRYVTDARQVIKREIRNLWEECLRKTSIRLPLLILDEAHHLKNPDTRLATLFRSTDSNEDANEVQKGCLSGVFERMLFLTATPFQLGHQELCSVLDRFDGVNWTADQAPSINREEFAVVRVAIRKALDGAQEAALSLDRSWGRLREEDLSMNDEAFEKVEEWWPVALKRVGLTLAAVDVVKCFERVQGSMKVAETAIRPWIIRHLKPRCLPGRFQEISRRQRFPGKSILEDTLNEDECGLSVSDDALLPFLLAARATSQIQNSRPVFAEGLASSYEAFLHTRRITHLGTETALDTDDDEQITIETTSEMDWYLNQLEKMIPGGADRKEEATHPKVSATVNRTVEIWRTGEKVVIFCHYIATGRMLRQRISEAISADMLASGAEKLGCARDEVDGRLDQLGKRFFDQDSPLRRACDRKVREIIERYPKLDALTDDLVELVRRNVRTPSFLVRFFPLEQGRLDEEAMSKALEMPDASGLTLRGLLEQFFEFLEKRCGETERQNYINAIKRIQTGSHFGLDPGKEYSEDELQGDVPERLVPNVRLVNGTTKGETRRRLMLAFNTPFYPEILVASSVLAEGVDLHLNCRHIIHHDLCWNPSTLEQRTGRIDRIGAKAESCGRPIVVYLPYIAETQDEKMYRVVMDRERWFSVLMGEDYKVDVRSTEKIAQRVPFPLSAAAALAFDLTVGAHDHSDSSSTCDGIDLSAELVSV